MDGSLDTYTDQDVTYCQRKGPTNLKLHKKTVEHMILDGLKKCQVNFGLLPISKLLIRFGSRCLFRSRFLFAIPFITELQDAFFQVVQSPSTQLHPKGALPNPPQEFHVHLREVTGGWKSDFHPGWGHQGVRLLRLALSFAVRFFGVPCSFHKGVLAGLVSQAGHLFDPCSIEHVVFSLSKVHRTPCAESGKVTTKPRDLDEGHIIHKLHLWEPRVLLIVLIRDLHNGLHTAAFHCKRALGPALACL